MTLNRNAKRRVRRLAEQKGIRYCDALQRIRAGGTLAVADMPPVIAFVGMKGGIGRTTMALTVACERAERGDNVLVVHVGHRSEIFRVDKTFAAILGIDVSRHNGREISVGNDLDPYWVSLRERTGLPGVTVADLRTADLARGALRPASRGFDLVILDSFAVFECQYTSLMLADIGIVPAQNDVERTLASANAFLQVVGEIRALPPEFIRPVVVRDPYLGTRRDSRIADAVRRSGLRPFESRLAIREAYHYAALKGLPLSRIPKRRAEKAAAEVADFLNELFPDGTSKVPWKSPAARVPFKLLDVEMEGRLLRLMHEIPPRQGRSYADCTGASSPR